MEVPKAWRVVWCTVWVCVMLQWAVPVHCDPISIDFSNCVDAVYSSNFTSTATPVFSQCCPVLPTRPIIDGIPPPTTSATRVRLAAQCTDATYAATVEKAYELMRALPDDDPRSFRRQWELHCAYCGGSFLTYNSSGDANGIDIHFSWLFLPWHRYFLYFHERILQSLLGDPTFSLNYWNWDNPFSVGDGTSEDGSCLSKGDNFPPFYNDPGKAVYDVNRSQNAMGLGRFDFPGFAIPSFGDTSDPLANATLDEVIRTNLNVMYKAMVSGGTTADTFMGLPYRAGDLRPSASPNTGGGGSLENGPHPAVHIWTGIGPPSNIDMGTLQYAVRDPVFFAHHSNVDRMWQVWNDIGSSLGQDHSDHSDSDFLEASFLFYDENQDLRRVKIKDCLDTTNLGYVYQQAPISQWLAVNETICSTLNYTELIAAADSQPVPVKDSSGNYELTAGSMLTFEIQRPNDTNGLEEFLIITGITLDRSCNGGFDVYVDLLDPQSLANPWKCPEFLGRFVNMANSRPMQGKMGWKQSIAKTFVDISAPAGPSTVVITLVSIFNNPTINFMDIDIELGT